VKFRAQPPACVARALQSPPAKRLVEATSGAEMNPARSVAACVTALTLSTAARAEDTGPYLGVAIGQATQSEIGFEDSATTVKLLGGYSFNKYFAVEGGYIHGGTLKDTRNGLDIEIENDGLFVAALAKLPLGDVFSLFAKIGYVTYDSDISVTNGVTDFSTTNSDEDLLLAGGCEFRLGGNFRLRAEFEKINVPDASFEIISLGAVYQF
jgi:OmpA-OmpF porin, OOP family